MKISIMGFVCADLIKEDNSVYIELGGSAGNVASILQAMKEDVYVWMPQYQGSAAQVIKEKLLKKNIQIVEFGKTQKMPPQIILEYNKENNKMKYYTKDQSDNNISSKVYLPTESHFNKNFLALSGTNLLYTDRLSAGIHLAIDEVTNHNGWIFYEPNGCRTYNAFLKAVGCADIVKFSSERIFTSYIERIKVDLIGAKTKIILLTQGDKGVKFAFRQKNNKFSEWYNIENIQKKKIVDSTGAGDWFSSIFIKLFVQKYPSNDYIVSPIDIENIVLTAQKVATFSCDYIGAQKILENENAWNEIRKISNILI